MQETTRKKCAKSIKKYANTIKSAQIGISALLDFLGFLPIHMVDGLPSTNFIGMHLETGKTWLSWCQHVFCLKWYIEFAWNLSYAKGPTPGATKLNKIWRSNDILSCLVGTFSAISAWMIQGLSVNSERLEGKYTFSHCHASLRYLWEGGWANQISGGSG